MIARSVLSEIRPLSVENSGWSELTASDSDDASVSSASSRGGFLVSLAAALLVQRVETVRTGQWLM